MSNRLTLLILRLSLSVFKFVAREGVPSFPPLRISNSVVVPATLSAPKPQDLAAMAVQLQINCADNQQVCIELKITEPALEEPAAVQPYEEPALFSPVKRNAVSISLAGEEGGSVTAEEVHGMFSFAGTIESFEVHEKGQSAVVTYSDEQAANTAMLLTLTLTLTLTLSLALTVTLTLTLTRPPTRRCCSTTPSSLARR